MSSAPPRTTYTLGRPEGAPAVPVLDEHQQRVVDHPGGPLLVLAGPGTGKTTTMVEAIVDRIEVRGADPSSVLALTFSRKAAEQLRDRVTARVARTTSAALCSTFHSFALSLIRTYSPQELYDAPLRLLSAPESDVVLRELLADNPESVAWPRSLQHALGTRGFAREVHGVLSRAREKGLDGPALRALGEEHRLPELVASGLFLDQYLTILDNLGATDHADLIRRAVIEVEAHRDELRARFGHVFVDEYQDTDPGPGRAAAGAGRRRPRPGGRRRPPPVDLRLPRRRRARHPRLPGRSSPPGRGSVPPVVVLRRTRRFGPRLLRASRRVAERLPLAGSIDARAREEFLHPESVAGPHGDGRVEVLTFDSERAEAEHLADLLRRAHLEDGVPWDDMAVLVRSGRASIPSLRRSLGRRGRPGRGRRRRAPPGARPGDPPGARRAAGRAQPGQRRPAVVRLPRPGPGGVPAALAAGRPGRRRPARPGPAAARPGQDRRRAAAHLPGAAPAEPGPGRVPRRARGARGAAGPGALGAPARGRRAGRGASQRRAGAVAPVVRNLVARAAATRGRRRRAGSPAGPP